MLLGQAARSFTLWTGLEAPLDAMREALRSELGAAADV
jgi:shikimate 5-dehydrogenase